MKKFEACNPFQSLHDAYAKMNAEAFIDYNMFGEYVLEVSKDCRTIHLLNVDERNIALAIKERFGGRMVELADTSGLEPDGITSRGGSTPSTPTKKRPSGEIGKHSELKIRRPKKREGSSPSLATKKRRA